MILPKKDAAKPKIIVCFVAGIMPPAFYIIGNDTEKKFNIADIERNFVYRLIQRCRCVELAALYGMVVTP